ncbi:NADPH-dependent FMN reductase [Kaistella palustris]|uniref:NADPH-dependent FMN reductase n=1 Tax=Kaistella palustris TaxID=493376 RepID=UPI000410F21D|nr:NADPH-dependent FMN reductase [Kaistella palustris]
MKILAFAGSSSSTSRNLELVKYVLKDFTEHDINLLDLNDFDMPVFSVDREKNGYPQAAHDFLKAIGECDAIICSLAEHNRSYTAAFKNVFDWASRIHVKVWQDKPMFLLSTSPGGYGGGNVMATAQKFFPQFGADIRETFSLPKFIENFDVEKTEITAPDLKAALDEKTAAFKQGL